MGYNIYSPLSANILLRRKIMEDFLNELYNGQIHPNEGVGKYHYKMLMLEKQCSKLLEELNQEIGEKAKENLKKYIDIKHEIYFYGEADAFSRGVGFTARFLMSALK